MRSMWSGYLGFGLVQAPVKLYKSSESHDQGMKRVHDGCGGHVGYKNYCKDCGAVPEPTEIVRGVERDDQMVVVTDDELQQLQEERGKQIEILQFVDSGQIDPIYYESSYYVGAPDGGKVYALLVECMESSGLVALARVTMRTKTYLACLRPLEGLLVLHTMLWPDELRAPEVPGLGKDYTAAELKGAKAVIASMVEDFDPLAYRDEYQDRLAELIDSKVDEIEFVHHDAPEALEEVSDLLAQLEASVRRKTGGKTPPAKRVAAKAPAKKAAVKAPARKKKVA